mmetsp:Transcript_4816/g.16792  ORF Transcript_4816/g.16792 Transcript_4816/m.16792 type:complete len:315 (-) Transcript_4816:757-1701(-)
MITSSCFTVRSSMRSKSSVRFSSVRCEKRKFALTACPIEAYSWLVFFLMFFGGSHTSSSSCSTRSASMEARFALDITRRTGRLGACVGSMDGCTRLGRVPLAGAGAPDLGKFWNIITMIVMSSVRVSYCSHRRYDSATMAMHASCGSSNLSTISTTAWLGRNSKTPSEAMTAYLVFSFTVLMCISGSANTPQLRSAAESPMERVKAVPGYMPFFTHSLGGSPSSSSSFPQHCTSGSLMPSSWSSVSTRAPARLTRTHSSARNGVWSWLRSTAVTLPRSFSSPQVARESPTFATTSLSPFRWTVIAVVPLIVSST